MIDQAASYADPGKTLAISGATYAPGDIVALSASGHAPFSEASPGQKIILRAGQNQATVTVTAFTDSAHVTATLDMAGPWRSRIRRFPTGRWPRLRFPVCGTSRDGRWPSAPMAPFNRR